MGAVLMKKLFPPPCEQMLPVPYPEFVPPFDDQVPPDYEEQINVREAYVGTRHDMTEATAAAAALMESARRQSDVMEAVGKRFKILGTVFKEVKGQPDKNSHVVIIYSYTNNVVVEARFRKGDLVDIVKRRYQPPLDQAEIRRAVELVVFPPDIPRSDSWEASAIGATRLDPVDPLVHHRLVDVGFGEPGERLPRVIALVDLSDEKMISIAPVRPDQDTAAN